MVSSSDRIEVSAPRTSAAYWSTVFPARRSAPSVLFGSTPFSQPAWARLCTPPPSLGLTTPRLLRPLTTVSRSRNGARGSRMGVISNPDPPSPAGWKLGRNMPFGP